MEAFLPGIRGETADPRRNMATWTTTERATIHRKIRSWLAASPSIWG
jgi:hypothetical protein